MAGVAGDPGSNPALGKQRSRDYPIDVPATPSSPMLTFATKKLPTGANEQKEDAVSFATVRAVLIEPLWLPMRSQWRQVLKHDCNMMLSHSNDSNHCQLGHLNSSQSHLVQVVVASLSENHDDRRLLSES